ncbi:restriction endonuclease subunit S [Salinibacillus kushneri]|uniref:restriction endonuclease subunit S n=1 Tax=Salinibacillus kushneri TaxID=237682 RepID=UPI0015A569DA|nr:restriction endonuclease subunit S [Salinibacillus kushneri]
MSKLIDWNKVSLRDNLDILTGYAFSSKKFNDSDGLPLIRIRDLLSHNPVTKYSGEYDELYLIEKNDVLIGMDGEFNIVRWKGPKSLLNQRVAKIKSSNKNLIDNKFIYYRMHSELKRIEALTPATTVKHLAKKDIQNLTLLLPPIKKQQKIAAILSSVDEAIEKTEQIIEQTETVKKGLMQQLLTKGIGHTEFKDSPFGKIPSNWKTVFIEDVVEINPENLSSKTDDFYELDYIDIASIEKNNITGTNRYLFKDAPSRARRKVKTGDTIVSTVRPYLRGFAYINERYNETVCSTGFAVLRSKNECHSDFLYQVILSDRFVNYLISNMTGSNYPAVKADDIKTYNFTLPPKDEQIKISNILSEYHKKIETELNKLTILNEIKKGLMQQLLTGKVRVPINENEEVPS